MVGRPCRRAVMHGGPRCHRAALDGEGLSALDAPLRSGMQLTREAFEAAIHEALAEIPPQFAPHMERLVVEVEDGPNPSILGDLGIDDPAELLGLYQGTPLTERSVEDHALMPDRVVIYQRNLESMC